MVVDCDIFIIFARLTREYRNGMNARCENYINNNNKTF